MLERELSLGIGGRMVLLGVLRWLLGCLLLKLDATKRCLVLQVRQVTITDIVIIVEDLLTG